MPVTYKKIASVTVTGATQATLEFTSIPNTFTDLLILLSPRCNDAGVARTIDMTFNSNTSNRQSRRILGDGSATSSASFSYLFAGSAPGTGSTASTFGNNLIYIPNYAGAKNKSYSVDGVSENNATTAVQVFWAGLWSDTAAITSIQLGLDAGSFVTNSTAVLYGIKKD